MADEWFKKTEIFSEQIMDRQAEMQKLIDTNRREAHDKFVRINGELKEIK